ncbi:alpha/beta hydrolase-fold protein [Spirosoma flavum]|uniref:Alpha/beta hydrolase-fold protein n=1 Tax=Spirosoma flavum TaxID=2048557 RepID=A0ABW6AUC0_9BACT
MRNTIYLVLLLLIAQTIRAQAPPEALEIPSKIFNGVRKVKVYLPDGYDQYPNRRYPVIYLFDAQSKPFLTYVKATLDYLSNNANTFISPVILVGVETMRSRQFEFLPKNRTDQPLKDYWPKVKLGGADSLATSLQEEIMTAIGSKYRCTNFNMGIGHSLGGSFVTYCLVKHPQLFQAVLALSPNYYYDQEQLLTTFDSLATGSALNKKFLYIAFGKGDKLEDRFRPSTLKMADILKKKHPVGLSWYVHSLDTDSHALTPIDGIYRGLVEFNKSLTASDEQIAAFSSDTKYGVLAKLKGYYQAQSDKMGRLLPTVEDSNHLAYNFFYSDKKQEAISLLEWALKLYPDDTNLYDSIGEIHQDMGHTQEALFYYTQGREHVEQEKPLLKPKAYADKANGFSGRIAKLKATH